MAQVMVVSGATLPEVWEESLHWVYTYGDRISTQYDAPEDPPSWDLPVVLEVWTPLQQPMFHRGIIGGIEDLEKYRMEVVEGIFAQPSTGAWPYTYHSRLFAYQYESLGRIIEIDQVAHIINALCACGHTRRAQAITWQVERDIEEEHAPCLQRVICRVVNNAVEMHVHFRSNDALKAAFFNMYALIDLQKKITGMVNLKTGQELGVGPYRHFVDSYHVYGKDEEALQRFFKLQEDRPYFADRTYSFSQVADIIKETREKYRPRGQKTVWSKYFTEALAW